MICSACSEIAPTIFGINEEKLYSFVKKQPEGEAEEAQAREAMEACCVEAIHDDGLEFGVGATKPKE